MKSKREREALANKKTELAKKIARKQQKDVYNFYSGLEEGFYRLIRFLSSFIDNIIFSERYIPIVSLVLALFLYFSINYDKDTGIFGQSLGTSRILSGVEVVTKYNAETFEISGVPDSCEVVLSGDAANVNSAAARKGACVLNLENYTEGTHLIELGTQGWGDSVNVALNPSNALITLKKKITIGLNIQPEYINFDKLESKYILSNPVFPDLKEGKVNIRASKDTLDSIAFIKALIDVTGVDKDFVKEAPLIAYDKNGQVVNADIYPDKVNVAVTVTSPHKIVPIVLNITGEVVHGKSIDTIKMDKQTADIYAPENILATLQDVAVELDASTLTRDSDITLPIILPQGVSLDENNKVVKLNIKLADTVESIIEDVPINYRNNNKNYAIKIADNQTKIKVKVSGSPANIKKIKKADITVYVDLADKDPGTYDLPLILESAPASSYVSYAIEQLTLKVSLEGGKNG